MASPDYGQDAPGIVRGLAIGGVLAACASFLIPRASSVFAITASICFVECVWMIWGSRVGKLRHRDRLLDGLALKADDRVLDVGCGHGLLLIGAAVRGARAVGIDLWSQTDQGQNSREATLENAKIVGVSDRVEVLDGDMRKLPFEDGRFDVVVANLAIHNIPTREGRRDAIREIVRVLGVGGRVALSDFQMTGQYADDLRAAGMSDVSVSGPSFVIFPPIRVVRGVKSGDSRN